MPEVTAIVLAAGQSSRMGEQDKLFLPFRESTIIETVIRNLESSVAHKIILVTSYLSHSRLVSYKNDRIDLEENKAYESGMTGSIQKGVQAAPTSKGYMICLGDQPLIRTATYDQLMEVFNEHYKKDQKTIVVPIYEGSKGNPVIFSEYYREDILKHHEPEGCKEIVRAHAAHVIKVSIHSDEIIRDIDTSDDYIALIG